MQNRLGFFLRTCGITAVFWANAALIRFALAENINYEGLISQEITGVWLFESAYAVLTLLYLYTVARLFFLQSDRFCEAHRENSELSIGNLVRRTFSERELYAELAVFGVIWTVCAIFYGIYARGSSLVFGRVWLSVLFLFCGLVGFFSALLFARCGAARAIPALKEGDGRNRYGKKRFSRRYPMLTFLLILIRNLLLFLLSAIAFPFVLSMLVGGVRIAAVLAAGLGVFLVVILLMPFVWSYARARLKRRKFLKRLKVICAENRNIYRGPGYIYEEGKHVRSVLGVREGADFTLRCGNETYLCKLIPARKYLVDVVFEEDGDGYFVRSFRFGARLKNRVAVVRVGGGELFRTERAFRYAFEGEGRKILIVNPVPKNMFIRKNGTVRQIDVGEKLGEYTIYNGSGFLNAVERQGFERTRRARL